MGEERHLQVRRAVLLSDASVLDGSLYNDPGCDSTLLASLRKFSRCVYFQGRLISRGA